MPVAVKTHKQALAAFARLCRGRVTEGFEVRQGKIENRFDPLASRRCAAQPPSFQQFFQAPAANP